MSQGFNGNGNQRSARPLRAGAFWGLATSVVLSLVAWNPPTSFGDSRPQDPTDPATPPTVTADALATVQIDGVVWSQAMSGNRVYAGGEFATATPAGGGASVPRSNLLAYDIVTGQLIASFAPKVDRQVTAVAVSPDESRIYVGGDFTSIDGKSRGHIAAYDGATGQLIEAFRPSINGPVHAIAATNTTVYAGGTFGGVGNQRRSSLAAFNAANGALLAWAPIATHDGRVGEVRALALKPDGTKVVVGGAFTSLNGSNPQDQTQSGYGLGMVDAVTGASQPFAVGTEVRDATINGAITSLHADDEYVYGGGYAVGRAGGTLEGVFSASWNAGEIHWINDCHGDTYSVHAQGDVIYTAGHAHYCENIAGLRQQDPTNVVDYPYYYRALAFGREDVGDVTWEPDHTYADFTGNRHSSQLTWYPSLSAGTYTGQLQGPWSVTGNDDYIAMGGEFTRVNGTNQSGLVRFAVSDIAPDQEGPQLFNARYPISVSSTSPGAVRVHWRANQDADNDYLTYKVQRRPVGGIESAIHTRRARAHFWNRPTFGYVDTDVGPGDVFEYRVQAVDPFGNTANSAWTPVTVASVDTESDYTAAVLDDEPEHFWQLGESQGTTAGDTVGFSNAATRSGVTGGAVGAIEGGGAASRFDGSVQGFARTAMVESPPDVLSLEAWFRTSSGSGGKLIGFQDIVADNRRDVDSDRHLYLDTAGRVNFGVRPDATRRVVRSTTPYNDGRWHLATGTLGPDGIRLYVDGVPQGHNSSAEVGQHLLRGYWRIGGSSLAGWPGAPATGFFTGRIDEVAVYKHVLSPAQVLAHFQAAGVRPPEGPNTAPLAGPVRVRTTAGKAVRFTLPATDGDQSNPLRLSVARPKVGTVTQPGADRVVTYTPGRRFAGTTSFTYTAIDELGLTSTGTITVVVGKSAATIGTVVVTPKPLTRHQVPVVTVPVRTAGAPAAGRVNVTLNRKRIGSGLLRANGRASIRLIKLGVGRRTLTIAYAGNAWTLKATKKVAVRVRR
ncbi:MAG: Ig-like domain-containing protein [Actinomycetota bacterium]|nr:Ig-like domain-containing protein [Actinomycetota bacterium]